jgi:tyrosyl-tRNA synthetase
MTTLLDVLRSREMLHDATPALADRLAAGPVNGYAGFDPTADSLHVGNLIPVMGLSWLQRLGGRPIVLIGDGTGVIGDPSGKRTERPMISAELVEQNAGALRRQLSQFLDFDGPAGAQILNNGAWLRDVSLLQFLRDTGKHFTVNYMLQKDSVKSRMEAGISYAEFSYMLVQAYDFAHLAAEFGCELQLGGSDQWGNITAGIELAARRDNRKLHGLALPLLTTSTGAKFGKTESGNVWLDPRKTSPYAFHQFWLQTDDADVARMLRYMTFVDLTTIDELMQRHAANRAARLAQRLLADDVTARVHGPDAARRVTAVAGILFGQSDIREADGDTLAMVASEIPMVTVRGDEISGMSAVDALVRGGLAASRAEARRGLGAGGYSINGGVVDDSRTLSRDDLLGDGLIFLRKGKRNWAGLRTAAPGK